VFFRDLWARYFTPIPLWTRFRGNVGNYMILDLRPKGRTETGPHNNLMGGVHRHSHRNRMPVSGSGQDSHYLIVRRSESSSA